MNLGHPLLRRTARSFGIFLLFALAYALMYPSCFQGLSKGYLGGSRGDAGIYLFLESINATRFFSLSSEGFDLPSFYPYRRALAYSDNFLLPALCAKVLLPLLGNEALVYNLIILAALVLNGYCTYLLVLKVTKSQIPAAYAGFVFMCFPYFVFHRGHPQLQFAFWIPLTVLATLSFSESRSWRAATGIGACVTGAFFCSVYYAMYCYLLAAVTLLALFALRPRSVALRDVLILTTSNLPWLALLLPAALPYMEVRESLGGNPLAVLRAHSPSLVAFVAPPAVEQLWSRHMRHISRMEGFLFFGFLPLVMCICAFLRAWIFFTRDFDDSKSRRWLRLAGWGTVAAILLSLVRAWHFASHPGNRTTHHLAWITAETFWVILAASLLALVLLGWRARERERVLTRLEVTALFSFLAIFFIFATLGLKDIVPSKHPAPELYRYLRNLPGYDALRGLARLGLVAVLMMITLAALWLAQLLERMSLRSRLLVPAVSVAVFLMAAAELHSRPEKLAPLLHAPRIYDEAPSLVGQAPVLALPIRSATVGGREFMFWNSLHTIWLRNAPGRIVNGFSGKVPLFHALVSHDLDGFPSRKSLSVLAELVGVHHVVTNAKFYGVKEIRDLRKRASKFPDEVREIKCDRSGSCVYAVSPVMDTRELQPPQLLVAGERAPQTLSFQVAPVSPPRGSDWTVSMQAILGSTVVQNYSLKLASTTEWQAVSVELPPTLERVNPFIIHISVDGAEGALIRNSAAVPVSPVTLAKTSAETAAPNASL